MIIYSRVVDEEFGVSLRRLRWMRESGMQRRGGWRQLRQCAAKGEKRSKSVMEFRTQKCGKPHKTVKA